MEREYVIFNVSELSKIDFSQVLETSADTVRKSVDETKTFVKWDGDLNGQNVPVCVQGLTTKEGPYTHSEIVSILSTNVWTDNTITP
jgi:hypothetical protein